VQRPAPLRQTVYEALVDLVVGGTLPPGQHLVEGRTCQATRCQPPAGPRSLHRLEAEGWVDLRPGQGAFVHVPTEHEVDRLLDVRSLLGAEAARIAACGASDEAVARLRARLREGADALAHDDPGRIVAANSALHAEITALSGNAILTELAAIAEWRLRWYQRPVAHSRGQQSWRAHEALIDAIEAGDPAQAAEVMRHHVEMTRHAYHHRPM